MNIDVFVCPSCGGKTVYNENTKLWECSYCHKSFQTVFAKEESIPVQEIKERTIYYNHCSNCNKDYASFEEKESSCFYCGSKNNSYDSIVASSFLTKTVEENNIKIYYNEKSLKQVPKKYKEAYSLLDFKLEYINCDLLDGIIELKYNNISKKYIFVNTIIPNLEYEDYRFMYELGNNGIAITNDDNDEKALTNKATNYITCIGKKKENHYDDIINTCINTFQKENNIVNRNEIKIENSVRLKQGFYIPVYRKDVVIDNTTYYQHVIAAKDFSRTLYLQYPNVKDSLKKAKKCEKISNNSLILIAISLVLFFYFALISFSQELIQKKIFIYY